MPNPPPGTQRWGATSGSLYSGPRAGGGVRAPSGGPAQRSGNWSTSISHDERPFAGVSRSERPASGGHGAEPSGDGANDDTPVGATYRYTSAGSGDIDDINGVNHEFYGAGLRRGGVVPRPKPSPAVEGASLSDVRAPRIRGPSRQSDADSSPSAPASAHLRPQTRNGLNPSLDRAFISMLHTNYARRSADAYRRHFRWANPSIDEADEEEGGRHARADYVDDATFARHFTYDRLLAMHNDEVEIGHRQRRLSRGGGGDLLAQLGIKPMSVTTYLQRYSHARTEAAGACCICLEEFTFSKYPLPFASPQEACPSSIVVLPSCSHAYHACCLSTWFDDHVTCPLCRQSVE